MLTNLGNGLTGDGHDAQVERLGKVGLLEEVEQTGLEAGRRHLQAFQNECRDERVVARGEDLQTESRSVTDLIVPVQQTSAQQHLDRGSQICTLGAKFGQGSDCCSAHLQTSG